MPTAQAGPDGPSRARPRSGRSRRRVRRLVLAAVLAVLAALSGASALLVALPSVSNAPALANAVVVDHGGVPTGYPPPDKVARSLVAIEDHAFYAPPVLDIGYGVARWAWGHLTSGGSQGGSTLAQQLAKRIYTGNSSSVAVKIEQVGLAAKLELRFSKPEIMTMYLDAAYFGDGSWGVGQASLRYFGKPPSVLSWPQAALLAGLVQSPSGYDPLRHPRAALLRRNEVLAQLAETGALTHRQARAYQAQGLGLG